MKWMASKYVVGDLNHPGFILRDSKRVFLGVGELHTRSQWLCPRGCVDGGVVEGIIDSWIGPCTGGLVMRYTGVAQP